MNINELLNYLDYDNLIKYLRERYKEVREGEFIVFEDKELEIYNILVVRKGQNYKEDVSRLKKEIEKDAGVVEGERREYGILFVGDQVVFLRRVIKGLESKVAVLRKSIDKISPAFKKKLKKLLKDVGNWQHWEELFDRSDIIEEFYKLYIKARENLLNNIEGIADDNKKEEFADNLLMQLLIIWYLQKRGFLNNDPNYLVNKFREYKRLGFKSYYDFLRSLFKVMMGEPNDGIYYRDDRFGRIVVTGPAPFLNGPPGEVEIPDKVFYIEGKTNCLKRIVPRKVKPSDVPILNLFESRDWMEGSIDEYVLGAIFEKLMTTEERKEKGAYYTPEPITKYICSNTIKPYLTDRINEKFGTKYESLDEFFEEDTGEEHYKFLFNELQNIKILDPASGSGHFLETAINVLVEIYEKIRERARKLGFPYENFVITTANEKGEIISEPLLAIEDEDERILKLKFHIIISRNIYGVDILPSAVKVARARLFLSLAKHFDAEKGVYVRFPNVHFNLRVGNSLIGFADTKIFEKGQRQVTLEEFFTNKYGEPLKIELSKKLEDYIKKMDNVIGTNAYPLLVEVRKEFNKKLTGKILEKVLRLRSDLIKILLVSLNTDYVVELKRLIDEITDRFNEKLNEEFVKHLRRHGIKIDVNYLREKIGYFHWIMEFSEVFLEKGGFDVVVGNPPYGRLKEIIKDSEEKYLMSKLYTILYHYQVGNLNLYKLFIERSYSLIKRRGYFSMIFPSSFLGENDSKKLRKLLFEKSMIKKILEFPERAKVFEGSTQAVTILVYKKEIIDQNYYFMLRTNIESRGIVNSLTDFTSISRDDLKALTGDEYRIPLFTNPKIEWEILKHISRYPPFKGDEKHPPVGDVGVGHLDETFDKEFMSDDPGDDLLIKGIHLDRYFVNLDPNGPKPRWIKNKERFFEKKPEAEKITKLNKIIGRNTINKASKPRLRFAPLKAGYVITNAIKFIIKKDENLDEHYIIATLNSTLLNWRFELFSLQNNIRNYEIKSLPIPRIPPSEQKPFITLVDYLLFLNATEERRNSEKEMIEFIDKQVVDSLVYELYFKQKFHEDGLYPEPKKYLLEAVSKHLKLINYNRWAELYWKKLKGNLNLSEDEEKELKELEEQNLNTIKEVYEELLNDEQIQELISKIKSHEWVKTIEAQFN